LGPVRTRLTVVDDVVAHAVTSAAIALITSSATAVVRVR